MNEQKSVVFATQTVTTIASIPVEVGNDRSPRQPKSDSYRSNTCNPKATEPRARVPVEVFFRAIHHGRKKVVMANSRPGNTDFRAVRMDRSSLIGEIFADQVRKAASHIQDGSSVEDIVSPYSETGGGKYGVCGYIDIKFPLYECEYTCMNVIRAALGCEGIDGKDHADQKESLAKFLGSLVSNAIMERDDLKLSYEEMEAVGAEIFRVLSLYEDPDKKIGDLRSS